MPTQVSTSTSADATYNVESPKVAVASDGTAFVLYYDGTEMVYRSAVSPYTTWSSATTLPTSGGNRFNAAIVLNAADNSIDVVYHQTTGGAYHVRLAYSSGTHTWSNGTAHTITTTAGSGSSGEAVWIGNDGTRIWTVVQQTSTTWEAYYSTDSGATWTASITGAAMPGGTVDSPCAAISGKWLVVFYSDNAGDVAWRRLDTTGTLTAWSTQKTAAIGTNPDYFSGDYAAAATDGNGRIVFCMSSQAFNFGSGVWGKVYDPSTDTFGSDTHLGSHTGGAFPDNYGTVVSNGADVWAIYGHGVATNSYELDYKKWTASTQTWDTSATVLEASGGNIAFPIAFADSSKLYFIYTLGTATPWSIEWDTATTSSSQHQTHTTHSPATAQVKAHVTHTTASPVTVQVLRHVAHTTHSPAIAQVKQHVAHTTALPVAAQVRAHLTHTTGTPVTVNVQASRVLHNTHAPATAQVKAHVSHATASPVTAQARTHVAHTTSTPITVQAQRHVAHTTSAPIMAQVQRHVAHATATPVQAQVDARVQHTTASPVTVQVQGNAVTHQTHAPAMVMVGKLPPLYPIISRNQPAFASDVTFAPSRANDGDYGTVWNSNTVPSVGSPVWWAVDLSTVPAAQRHSVVVAIYNETADGYWLTSGTYDNQPRDYILEINTAAGGGSPPVSGWTTVASVTGNIYWSREHAIDLGGTANWLRLTVTASNGAAPNNDVAFQLDVHDAHQGDVDDWLLLGDSITAEATGRRNIDGTSWTNGPIAEQVNTAVPFFFPLMQDGGFGGQTMTWGATNIASLLAPFTGHYVSIGYGTNDLNVGFEMSAAQIAAVYADLITIIDAILARGTGMVPIVPYVPYGTNNSFYLGINAAAFNRYVDAHLPHDRPGTYLRGPDLYTAFYTNPQLLRDGIHPTFAANADGTQTGYDLYHRVWRDWIIKTVYQIPMPTHVTASPVTAQVQVASGKLHTTHVTHAPITAAVHATPQHYTGPVTVQVLVGVHQTHTTASPIEAQVQGHSAHQTASPVRVQVQQHNTHTTHSPVRALVQTHPAHTTASPITAQVQAGGHQVHTTHSPVTTQVQKRTKHTTATPATVQVKQRVAHTTHAPASVQVQARTPHTTNGPVTVQVQSGGHQSHQTASPVVAVVQTRVAHTTHAPVAAQVFAHPLHRTSTPVTVEVSSRFDTAVDVAFYTSDGVLTLYTSDGALTFYAPDTQ